MQLVRTLESYELEIWTLLWTYIYLKFPVLLCCLYLLYFEWRHLKMHAYLTSVMQNNGVESMHKYLWCVLIHSSLAVTNIWNILDNHTVVWFLALSRRECDLIRPCHLLHCSWKSVIRLDNKKHTEMIQVCFEWISRTHCMLWALLSCKSKQ